MDPAPGTVATNLARSSTRPQIELCYLVQGSKVMFGRHCCKRTQGLSNCLFLSQSIKYKILYAPIKEPVDQFNRSYNLYPM